MVAYFSCAYAVYAWCIVEPGCGRFPHVVLVHPCVCLCGLRWAPWHAFCDSRLVGWRCREWAQDGLRTLVFAYKPLTFEEVQAFLAEYNRVSGNLVERQKKVGCCE